jgi:acetyl-CoA carboxylase biotin carboxyl carrier protein
MDLKQLYALMERFEKSGLSELTFKNAGDEVTLKKGVTTVVQAAPAAFAPAAGAAPQHAPAQAGADAERASGIEVIRAPLVGTFYRSPAPDAAPFVEKGDRVKKGQTICILEAMKLMNEFQAEHDLEIVAVLVDNGTMVEFGTPLFEVRRT